MSLARVSWLSVLRGNWAKYVRVPCRPASGWLNCLPNSLSAPMRPLITPWSYPRSRNAWQLAARREYQPRVSCEPRGRGPTRHGPMQGPAANRMHRSCWCFRNVLLPQLGSDDGGPWPYLSRALLCSLSSAVVGASIVGRCKNEVEDWLASGAVVLPRFKRLATGVKSGPIKWDRTRPLSPQPNVGWW